VASARGHALTSSSTSWFFFQGSVEHRWEELILPDLVEVVVGPCPVLAGLGDLEARGALEDHPDEAVL
jgi:hypothetical protein